MFYSKNYQIQKYQSNYLLMRYCCLFIFTLIFTGLIFQATANAQNTAATQTPQLSVSPTVYPTPIPFSDVIGQSDQANFTLQEIASNTAANPTADIIERDLPALTDEINARVEETAQVVANRLSLENLRRFENDWRVLAKNLPQWKNDLTDSARKLEANLTPLNDLEKKWQTTQSDPANNDSAPVEVTARIQSILTASADARRQIGVQQARIVSLQDRVAEQQKRVDGAIASIRETRTALVGQLLVQDSPPIWSRELWAQSQADVLGQSGASLSAQLNVLRDFAGRNFIRIIIHLLVFIGFAGSLIFLRRRAHPWVEKDAALKNAAVIFYLPISTALVLAILFSSQIYPQTPQIMGAIFGAIVLIPTIIILRKLIERSLYPILYSLVIFILLIYCERFPIHRKLSGGYCFWRKCSVGFCFFSGSAARA